MKIFSIELKITLLILVIVASIIATGYLSYKNLSQIVHSIHREARPDYKLIKIKEITSDLAEVDNSVQLYSLTRDPKYLKPYNRIISTVDRRVEELLSLQGNDTSQVRNINAIQELIGEKLVVWDRILQLKSKTLEKEVFDDFYTEIEKRTTDSVTPKKNNILKRFFKKKKDITLGKEEVTQEVAKLERSLNSIAHEQAESESQLLRKSNQLGAQLQFLILQLEQKETEGLFIKSIEAEIRAQETYKWLAIFCIAAVLLLIVVLLIIINYSRKSSQSQQALQLAKNEADRLVKARELFTANVSHELRTPMNAIYGLSEQLLQYPVDENLKGQLEIIQKSAGYLNRIVNDILDFSKIEAGKLRIEKIDFSPGKIFEEVCSLNQIIASQKKVEFHCDLSKDIPQRLAGDPTRLRQIILNLLSNAFKFTDKGAVSLIAKTSPVSENSVSLTVSVIDTGIGIAPDKLNTIFDEYTQADESTNRRFGGTGLGLSIVKRLLEMMHGSIEVNSELNKGSVFTFTIPFEVADETELPSEEVQSGLSFIPKVNGISVLVADDEEYNRMLLHTIFKKWGMNYKNVSNGRDAVALANEFHFDIILMDIRMPELNGYDAAREILAKSPKTKIIALTAGNYTDDVKKCREAGMADYLLKPFPEKKLYDVIMKTLGLETVSQGNEPDSFVNGSPGHDDQIMFDELYKVSGGDETFVEEMLNLFIKTTKAGMQQLLGCFERRDWKGLSDAAHKMAPPCRHLGAMNLYHDLKTLEKLGDENIENKEADKAKLLIDTIEGRIHRIVAQIGQKTA